MHPDSTGPLGAPGLGDGGDRAALAHLYLKARRPALRKLRRRGAWHLGGYADGEDFYHDAFAILCGRRALRPGKRGSRQAFVQRVALNELYRALARQLRRTLALPEPAPRFPDPAQAAELKEELELLTLALGALEEIDRTILGLRDIQGLPFARVAQLVGLSETAVRRRCDACHSFLRASIDSRRGTRLRSAGRTARPR